MRNKEILEEEEFLSSTGETAALDQTMFSTMETFEISGKVLPPIMLLLGEVAFLLATENWKTQ